jgi:hypothetical protein
MSQSTVWVFSASGEVLEKVQVRGGLGTSFRFAAKYARANLLVTFNIEAEGRSIVGLTRRGAYLRPHEGRLSRQSAAAK